MFACVIIFIISLAGYGGVILYTESVDQSITKAEDDLRIYREESTQFGIDQLNDISRLELRLQTAQYLLDNHVSMLKLFNDLEGYTYQTVRFKSFKYTTAEDGKISLKMTGEANSYQDINDAVRNNYVPVALQSAKFAGIRNMNDVLFSDLNLDQSGNVVFSFNSILDPRYVSYRDNRLP